MPACASSIPEPPLTFCSVPLVSPAVQLRVLPTSVMSPLADRNDEGVVKASPKRPVIVTPVCASPPRPSIEMVPLPVSKLPPSTRTPGPATTVWPVPPTVAPCPRTRMLPLPPHTPPACAHVEMALSEMVTPLTTPPPLLEVAPSARPLTASLCP